jgi:hypothetical protein
MGDIENFALAAPLGYIKQREISITISHNIALPWQVFYCLRSKLLRLQDRNDSKCSLMILSLSISIMLRNII